LDPRVLQDETGVYKNLLQETAHRAGLKLPAYTTVRSGPGHSPVFASTVELAGMSFAGDPAKTKKQAEKNAAMAAWSSLKQSKQSTLAAPEGILFPWPCTSRSSRLTEQNATILAVPEAHKEPAGVDEQEHVLVARVLAALKSREGNSDGKSAATLPKHCGTGSSVRTLPNQPPLYRHQWRPLNAPARPPMLGALHPTAGPKILPVLHQPSSSSTAELVRLLERVMVMNNRAAGAIPPSPCYYSPATALPYHHGGAPRSFAAGGFHAPAVSVRSVIPVCAAPPPAPVAARKEERSGPASTAEAGKSV
jgi:hypothetical protein